MNSPVCYSKENFLYFYGVKRRIQIEQLFHMLFYSTIGGDFKSPVGIIEIRRDFYNDNRYVIIIDNGYRTFEQLLASLSMEQRKKILFNMDLFT
jgi:hypothetical protein